MCTWIQKLLNSLPKAKNHPSPTSNKQKISYGETPEEIINYFVNLIRSKNIFYHSMIQGKRFDLDTFESHFTKEGFVVEKGFSSFIKFNIDKNKRVCISYYHDDEDGHCLKINLQNIQTEQYLWGAHYYQ